MPLLLPKLARFVLLTWGIFDVLTGIASVAVPSAAFATTWPAVDADGEIMIRRAGVFWLAMGIAQLAAFRKPTPERLRLAALVRLTDGFADLVWLFAGPAFTPSGFATIGPSPLLCLLVAGLLWWVARSTSMLAAPAAA
jgi:hypothetical protein